MKTIKQIADELGVSKQAVQKRLSREPLCTRVYPYIDVVQGTKYIQPEGEKLIIQAFKGVGCIDATVDKPIDAGIDTSIDTGIDSVDIVSILKNQNDILQKELDIKNKQIEMQQQSIQELTAALESTTQALTTAQALHAGTIQQQLKEPEEPKKGFFSRWFDKGL